MNVVFSAAVTVTGTPQLALVIGTDTTPRANYASGSGTQTLQFDYEVAAGDEDTDGITVPANALTLNGGTITASGTAANLGLDLAFLGCWWTAEAPGDAHPREQLRANGR